MAKKGNKKGNKKGSGKKISATKRNKRRVGGSIIEGEHENEDEDSVFWSIEKSDKKGSKRSKKTDKSSSKKMGSLGAPLQYIIPVPPWSSVSSSTWRLRRSSLYN